MSGNPKPLHATFKTRLGHDDQENALDVRCSCSPVVTSSNSTHNDYNSFLVNVNVDVRSVNEDDRPRFDSSGLEDLLSAVHSGTPLNSGSAWRGRVLVVVPSRAGFLARTKCFKDRFVGCGDLGVLRDRTTFAQSVGVVDGQDLRAILDGSVLMIVLPASDTDTNVATHAIDEVHARLDFQWILDREPSRKTLAVVGGRPNMVSFLPIYEAATALGIDLVILDQPTHWLADPSKQHLYRDFVPVDIKLDDTLHTRIVSAVKGYGNVDGLCTIPTSLLTTVAKAAGLLGLPTEPPEAVTRANDKYQTRLLAGGADPTALVADVQDLKDRVAEKTFVPRYPLIVKPYIGWGSSHVYRVDSETELFEGVKRICSSSTQRVLIEAYIDGPETDVNFVLLDGEILFFEVADDFPSPGDSGTIDSDFWESCNVLPSKLPDNECAVIRESLHKLLLQIGLKTGVFHLEARVRDSCMTYSEEDGLLDLRPKANVNSSQASRCFLIEVNPRPPGFQCIPATVSSYGINLYALHLLSSVKDYERFRALSKPFRSLVASSNHARAWTQLIWLRADKGGTCTSDDVCGEFLQKLRPEYGALVTESVCFFRRGDRIPAPKQGSVVSGAFFVLTSTKSREDVLRASEALQREFSIPVAPV